MCLMMLLTKVACLLTEKHTRQALLKKKERSQRATRNFKKNEVMKYDKLITLAIRSRTGLNWTKQKKFLNSESDKWQCRKGQMKTVMATRIMNRSMAIDESESTTNLKDKDKMSVARISVTSDKTM